MKSKTGLHFVPVMPLYFDTIRDPRKVHARLDDGTLACKLQIPAHCWDKWCEVDLDVGCKRCLKFIEDWDSNERD